MKQMLLKSALEDYQNPGNFPITLSICFVTCLLGLVSLALPVMDWFRFDSVAIAQNEEYWRLITGHFVHTSLAHGFWNMAIFIMIAAYLERKSPEQLSMGLSLAIIGLGAYMLSPIAHIEFYSGLSGISYCLLILAYWEWQKNHSPLVGLIPALLIIGKTLFVMQAGETASAAEGWLFVVEAQIIGVVLGLAGLFYLNRRNDKAA